MRLAVTLFAAWLVVILLVVLGGFLRVRAGAVGVVADGVLVVVVLALVLVRRFKLSG
jgi:hypothetical protein